MNTLIPYGEPRKVNVETLCRVLGITLRVFGEPAQFGLSGPFDMHTEPSVAGRYLVVNKATGEIDIAYYRPGSKKWMAYRPEASDYEVPVFFSEQHYIWFAKRR